MNFLETALMVVGAGTVFGAGLYVVCYTLLAFRQWKDKIDSVNSLRISITEFRNELEYLENALLKEINLRGKK